MLKEEILNKRYFAKAKLWYYNIYVAPLFERSILTIILSIVLLLGGGMISLIYNLLPLSHQIIYTIKLNNTADYNAKITRVDNRAEEDSIKAIAMILAKNYVKVREEYNYDNLTRQMKFVQNSSTAATFKKYYNYIEISNPQSPVLRYQKYAIRKIKILSSTFVDNNTLLVNFHATTTEDPEKNIEDMNWQATIGFNIDPIDLASINDTPYKFLVTYYKLKLLDNNNAS